MRVGPDAFGRMFRAVMIKARGVDLAVLRGNALHSYQLTASRAEERP